MAPVTKELNFQLYQILVHLHLSSHIWLGAIVVCRQFLPGRSDEPRLFQLGDPSVVLLQTQFFPQSGPILKKTRHTPEASIPAPSLAAPGSGQPQRRPSCSRSLPSHCFLGATPPLVPGVLPHFPPSLLITARRRVLMGRLIQITEAFGLFVALATPAP